MLTSVINIFLLCVLSFVELNLQGGYHFPDTLRQRIEQYEDVDAAGNHILNFYLNNGYPYASLTLERAEIHDSSFSLFFNITEGPRVVVEEISFTGVKHTSHSYLILESGLGENFIYNKQLIDEAVRDINKIDFLRSNPNPRLFMLSRPEKARLDFLLTELKTNTFYGALSYSPEEKLFYGDALLIIKNIYGNGHSFKILWKRIDEDKTLWQGEIKLTWLFSKPVDFKINISFRKDISYSQILTRSILSYFKNNWEFYTGIEYINIKHNFYTLEQLDNMSGLFLDTRDFPVNPTSGLLFNFEVKTGQTNYNTMKNINTYLHVSLSDYFSLSKFVLLFSSGFSGFFSSNYIEDILLVYGGDKGPRGYLPESFKTNRAILNTVETRYIISKYNNIFIFFDCLIHNNSGSTFTDVGYGIGMMTGGDNVSVKAYISANPEIKDFSSILLSTQLEYNF